MVVAQSENGLAAQIYSSWPLETAEKVEENHQGIQMDTTGAFAESIDGYCRKAKISRVNVVKIDVDGYECDVLRGAKDTLRTQGPSILIELSPHYDRPGGDSFEDLLQLLSEADYQLWDESKTKRLPMDGSLTKLIPTGGSIDALAIPASRSN